VDTTSYKNVWVFIEHERGKVANVSFELLGQGRKLADDLGCELCGMLLTDREGSDGYIQEAVAPYTRFVRAEREKLLETQNRLKYLQTEMEKLKANLEKL
jgi:electron transfer flavoprotein alpha subunit